MKLTLTTLTFKTREQTKIQRVPTVTESSSLVPLWLYDLPQKPRYPQTDPHLQPQQLQNNLRV